MPRILGVVSLAVLCFVFLGNALKSVVTSTVFVSEGEFASFLNISVDKTQILVELLIGSSVMALALAPFLLSRDRAQKIATACALTAAACYLALGLTLVMGPALFVRELVVILTFAISGFCISFFAPIAQLAINEVENERERVLLTTVWTSAQPVAFLITPQLVKYVAMDIGTGNYFLIFSAFPVFYLLLTRKVLPHGDKTSPLPSRNATTKAATSAPPPIPRPAFSTIAMIIAGIAAFEAWTISNSLAGVTAPVSLALMSGFFIIALLGLILFRKSKASARQLETSGKTFQVHSLPPTALFLLIGLFLLEVPSTGFYDAAYLVRHLCSSNLIQDRASLGAAAQIAAVALGGGIFVRWPHLMPHLLITGILLLLVGTTGYITYPDLAVDASFFYTSKMISSAGMGLVTTVIVGVVMCQCRGNPVMALLPALVIMFGTEFGLEILEIVYQIAKMLGQDEVSAYRTIFYAQVVAIIIGVLPCIEGLWLNYKVGKSSQIPA
ncbi:hypothetical protein O4H49_02200 [Kiloniella laminariae]|uniref:Major facilitator superfamily (MFS) profile domain-containing protein n=1 Tax=Kiloniella laminariae TaxID=454162 RepID=A0ABT4LGV3_9PROT|nr:hypothetical protein [Kiloniella laminariae]MCZ4279571.1 hypothetical protein [Kiloniella laminariae]